MDAGGFRHYLGETMTRHFFALLALLTGLAAFGSPAQASLAEALACSQLAICNYESAQVSA